jgi:hypothetical protein
VHGRSINIRVRTEDTVVRRGKRQIPPFRCILDAKPISETDFFGSGGRQFAKESTTYFKFKRTPECPVEHFAAKRSPYDLRQWATDVKSLKFNLGPGFEVIDTCGGPKLRTSAKVPTDRDSKIYNRHFKDLSRENADTAPASNFPAQTPKSSQGVH